MYKCEHFKIQELVPPSIYKIYGEFAWHFFDDRALITLDRLRDKYGPTVVNNWHIKGNRQWSGLRTPESPDYSPGSQHTFGRAFDCIFKEVSADQVRKDLLDNPEDLTFKLITAVEAEVWWFHFDVRNCKRIMIFKP